MILKPVRRAITGLHDFIDSFQLSVHASTGTKEVGTEQV